MSSPILSCSASEILYAAGQFHDNSGIVGTSSVRPYRGNMVDATTCDVAYQYWDKKVTPMKILGTDARRFHFSFDSVAGIWKVISMEPPHSGVSVDQTVPQVFPTLAPATPVVATRSYMWLWLFILLVFAALAGYYVFFADGGLGMTRAGANEEMHEAV